MNDRQEMKNRLIAATKKAGLPVDMKAINKMIDETPLVSYNRDCGHDGRGYAVQIGDWIFCDSCQRDSRVMHTR